MQIIFVLSFFVALFGVIRPFKGLKRWHFALAAFVAFVGVAITAPKPTPEQIAARERKEKAGAIAKVEEAQNSIIDRARATIDTLTPYIRNEYRKTYARVGKATFSKLGDLEPGAVYAVAESRKCDKVVTAMVSDRSKPGKAMWFVDCANDNRFMIEQEQAEAALARFKSLCRKGLSGRSSSDSRGLLRPDWSRSCGPRPPVGIIADERLVMRAI